MGGVEYQLSYSCNDWQVSVNYELLNSEFEKNGFLGGTASSRNKCSIQAKTSTKKADFRVQKQSWLHRIIRKNTSLFRVTCNNEQLSRALAGSMQLFQLFSQSANRPEFEPEITGKWQGDEYVVSILYQTQGTSPEIMNETIAFVDYLASINS